MQLELTNDIAKNALSIIRGNAGRKRVKFDASCKKANRAVIPSRLNNKAKPKAYPRYRRSNKQYLPGSWIKGSKNNQPERYN